MLDEVRSMVLTDRLSQIRDCIKKVTTFYCEVIGKDEDYN